MPDSPRAFVSYSRTDSNFALRLVEDLKAAGANVWLDQLDIEPGTPWDSAIENALLSSGHLIVILSNVSVTSDNVRDEISYALGQQMKVIPVLYQECKVPFRLARLQHIDFRNDYPAALRSLLKTLRVEQVAQPSSSIPTPPQPTPDPPAEAAEHQRIVDEAALQAEANRQLVKPGKQEKERRQREETARQAAEAEQQRAPEKTEQTRKQEQQAREKQERKKREQAEATRQAAEAEKQRAGAEQAEQKRKQEQQAKQEAERRQRAEPNRQTAQVEKQRAAAEQAEQEGRQKQPATSLFASYAHAQAEQLESSIQKTPWPRIARYACIYGAFNAFTVWALAVLYGALQPPFLIVRLVSLSFMTIAAAVLSVVLMRFKPQLNRTHLLIIVAAWLLCGFVSFIITWKLQIIPYLLPTLLSNHLLSLGLYPNLFIYVLSQAAAGAATGSILASALQQPRRLGVAIGLISIAIPELLFQWFAQKASGINDGLASYISAFLLASIEAALLLWLIRDWGHATSVQSAQSSN